MIDGTAECPVGSPEWCAWAIDKIEGLDADLREAVRVAYRRGAVTWARLNYPVWAEHFAAEDLERFAAEGTRAAPPKP